MSDEVLRLFREVAKALEHPPAMRGDAFALEEVVRLARKRMQEHRDATATHVHDWRDSYDAPLAGQAVAKVTRCQSCGISMAEHGAMTRGTLERKP